MRHPSRRVLAVFLLAMAMTVPSFAQFSAQAPSSAPGNDYVVELGVFRWQSEPAIALRTESLNIIGTTIDLLEDLGIEKKNLPDFRFVLRPARRHKLRVSYVPIHYEAETVLRRTIVFNGTTYVIGLPIASDFEWKAWRFGYEFDFIARDRGFVGLIVEAKYTDVKLAVSTIGLAETAAASVPIPAVGGTFRVYPAPFLGLTGEVTGIRLPGSLTEGEDSADYLDWDLYATLDFTRNIGVQVGYRTLDLNYRYDEEFGDFELKGPYFGGVVRF
jgi:hypothetical protein